MPRPRWRAIPVAAALLAAGCAGGGFRAPDDPVDEARLRIADVVQADARAVCAAQVVEGDRGLAALRSLGGEGHPRDPGVRGIPFTYRGYEASQMNLSQASALMAGAHQNGKAAQAAVYAGQPNAHLMTQYAMAGFDAVYGAVTNPRPVSRGGRSGSDVTFAEARYAMVWTEYLASPPEAEGRDQMLDWLTSRSMENLDLLRAYHREFSRALRRRCD